MSITLFYGNGQPTMYTSRAANDQNGHGIYVGHVPAFSAAST